MSGPLRIGVDARELLGDSTGVGRYLGELMRRWTARRDADRRRFVLYSPEALSLPLPPRAVEHRIGGRARGTWWEQTWLRRAVSADRLHVFFAPAYTAPLGTGVPLVVTIHDVSFAAHPEWFRIREGLRRRWFTAQTAQSASVVLTVSRFSKSEIERHLAVDPRRVRVIYEGVEPRAADAPPADGRPPLVLYVGSILNRRRLPDLIAAFARVQRALPAARLVIAGDDRSWPRLDLAAVAYEHAVERQVEFRRYVTDDDLARLYSEASVFAFLSEYEGFGITPLEALAANVPAVVLETAVAREIYGDAAVYVPADDISATADALLRLLTVPAAREAVLACRPAVLSRYSWDAAASKTLEVLESIAAHRQGAAAHADLDKAADDADYADLNKAADHADDADLNKAADHADHADPNKAADHADHADPNKAADHADHADLNKAADYADDADLRKAPDYADRHRS